MLFYLLFIDLNGTQDSTIYWVWLAVVLQLISLYDVDTYLREYCYFPQKINLKEEMWERLWEETKVIRYIVELH